MSKMIYYLPGHGGKLDTGLGKGLLDRGYDIAGRMTRDEFKELTFSDQVSVVADDLKEHFWTKESRVIANSFGAYLFLHAQAQLEPYIGRVLLLSPIVGEFEDSVKMMNFIPPKAGLLMKLALEGLYPAPINCDAHVGGEDWQSNPDAVSKLGKLLNFSVNIVQGVGHNLGVAYVSSVLDKWLLES
jgi:alpha-beta hydrolase superfamily lysophospholipase